MNSIEYEWVIARYQPKNPNGASALAELTHGMGYILVNGDRAPRDPVVVAFKRPMDSPRPHYLEPATLMQADNFEKIDASRKGRR